MFNQTLLCPSCRMDYTHLDGVTFDAKTETASITGTCEHGHAFRITLAQHKGQTFITNEVTA